MQHDQIVRRYVTATCAARRAADRGQATERRQQVNRAADIYATAPYAAFAVLDRASAWLRRNPTTTDPNVAMAGIEKLEEVRA